MTASASAPQGEKLLLTLDDVEARYGRARILNGIDLDIFQGEIAVLLGRNGAGKSTLLKTVMGLVRASAGRIVFEGVRIDRLPPYRIARLGIGYVPEERRIFTGLSVRENLEVARRSHGSNSATFWTEPRLFELFPNLAEKPGLRAGQLSGGEQQMLAVARTLMGNPHLLLLDEPSEGLAPVIVEGMAKAIGEIKKTGISILLSEQNLAFAERISDRAYILEKGEIRFDGSMDALRADPERAKSYLAL